MKRTTEYLFLFQFLNRIFYSEQHRAHHTDGVGHDPQIKESTQEMIIISDMAEVHDDEG